MNNVTKLFNRNLIILMIAIFLMYSGFHLVMPIIAMYVTDTFSASASTVGFVVSVYVISALIARPFSGYLVDHFDRKRFYLVMLFIFSLLFIGYIVADSVGALIATRVALGAAFSLATTAGSTLAIDLMPASRRNEGIGYIGVVTILSMAIGPMLGLYIIEQFGSYDVLFRFAFVTAMLGFVAACFVHTEHREVRQHQTISFDRFIIKEAISISALMMFAYFSYGALMTYIPLYLKECGLTVNPAGYFLMLAAGIIFSRYISAKMLKRGLQSLMIQVAIVAMILALAVFVFLLNSVTFIIASFIIGVGFGLLSPSVQSMVVDLVPHNRRGTANSTYYVALDLGSGLGMLVGGVIAGAYGYKAAFVVGLALSVISFIYYTIYAKNHYAKQLERSKLNQ